MAGNCVWGQPHQGTIIGFKVLADDGVVSPLAKALQQTIECDAIFVPEKLVVPTIKTAQSSVDSPTRS